MAKRKSAKSKDDDSPRVRLKVMIEPHVMHRLRMEAASRGTTLGETVSQVLDKALPSVWRKE